jgi:hypothetical protein
MPVLSRHGHDLSRYTTYSPTAPTPISTTSIPDNDHILFTKFDLGQPAGMVVLCPFRCNQEITSRQTEKGVRLRCRKCQSRVTIPQFKTGRDSPLRKHALVAVRFPQGQYPTVKWDRPSEEGEDKRDEEEEEEPEVTPPPPKIVVRSSSLPSKTRATPTTTPTPPPPSRATLRLPKLTVRSTSLPSTTTVTPVVTPRQSSSSLRIRIPARVATPNLSPAGPSGSGGIHSAAATPPPPSPHESPRPQKRSLIELARAMPKRRRHQEGKD